MKHYLWNRIILFILRFVAGPFVRRAMRYRCRKKKGPDTPSLIISNHNSNLDPALVAMGFSRHIYFITSEHALRNGLPSKILNFVFAPIPINKTLTDVSSIKEIMRRIKAGANVCLFAEGDRSFTGTTAPLTLSTAKLAKMSKADLITFRIDGGYFTTPRWSKSIRKGKMSGGIVNTYPAAELKKMTAEQVLEIIERDIYVDAYEDQMTEPVSYRGKNLAENIETVLYLCPCCKRIATIRSEGDRFSCDCGLSATYTETGFIKIEAPQLSNTTEDDKQQGTASDSAPLAPDSTPLAPDTAPLAPDTAPLAPGSTPRVPHSLTTVTDWGRWQKQQLVEIVQNIGDEPICTHEGQQLFEVRVATGKTLVREGTMKIYRETFDFAGITFPLREITRFTVVGQMILLFALDDGTTYEIRSAVPRSALFYKEVFQIIKSGQQASKKGE